MSSGGWEQLIDYAPKRISWNDTRLDVEGLENERGGGGEQKEGERKGK